MLWRDVVGLVKTENVADGSGGFTETETSREVLANVKSVKRSEFYAAHAAGVLPSIVVELNLLDYEDEVIITYNGKRFYLVRDYSPNGEKVELTCSTKKVER